MDDNEKRKGMGKVIQIDEARIRDHLGEMVRGTLKEALNAMLDAEADRLCGAGRYERSEGRKDTRAGSYRRSLETKAGKSCLNLAAARLRHIAGTQWATRKYINMTPLFAEQTQGAVVA